MQNLHSRNSNYYYATSVAAAAATSRSLVADFFSVECTVCKKRRIVSLNVYSLSISFVETVGPAEGASSVVVHTCCSCSAQTSSSSVRHSSVVSVRVMDLQRSSSPPGTTTDSQICGMKNKLAILMYKQNGKVCLSVLGSQVEERQKSLNLNLKGWNF